MRCHTKYKINQQQTKYIKGQNSDFFFFHLFSEVPSAVISFLNLNAYEIFVKRTCEYEYGHNPG